MTICRYFLQGNCMFGARCRYEHPTNIQNINNQNVQKPSVHDKTLISTIITDMTAALKGNQWPFSCYGPFKDAPCLPGLSDISMEELRYAYYEAVRNGTIEQYKANIQKELELMVKTTKAFQNPSIEVMAIIRAAYQYSINNTPKVEPTSVKDTFSFAQQPVNVPQQPILSQNQNFQNFSNFFPSNTSLPPIQQLPPPPPPAPVIQIQPPVQPQQIIAEVQSQQKPNVQFSFVNPQSTVAKSAPAQIEYSIYSKLEDLTPEEIKWFESDRSTIKLENIPDKPPTYEMCFKC